MSFSIGKFISVCWADAKAAEQAIVAFVPKVDAALHAVQAVADPILAAVDKPAQVGMDAFVALFDELAATIKAGATKNADGTVTLNVSAATVTQAEGVLADSESWLSKIGVKL